MARWREPERETLILPDHLKTFVASRWFDFSEPLKPMRIGSPAPTLECSPGGESSSWPTDPPDPHECFDGLQSPRSSLVDPQGCWWRDERVRTAHARFLDARRAWDREHPEYGARQVRELVERRLERAARWNDNQPGDADGPES